MTICYHCGEESKNLFICTTCNQNYCFLHIDPIIHECNLVIKSQELHTKQEISDSKNIAYRNQCWFCGLFNEEVYYCNYCHQYYCKLHKELKTHDCPTLFSIQDTNLEQIIEEKSESHGSLIKSDINESGLPDIRKIELDSTIVRNSVNRIIQSYIDNDEDHKFRKIMARNPNGKNLIIVMNEYLHHPLIKSLSLWLGGMYREHFEVLRELENNQDLLNEKLTLHQLIMEHYSNLIDASYYDHIKGVDPITGNKIETNIVTKGSISISKKVLTYISEHSRKSGYRECTGLLVGRRNPDGTIEQINGYNTLGLGANQATTINPQELVKLMIDLKDSEETIVGWYHSHPENGVPAFSPQDKNAHLKLAYILSIFNYLKRLEGRITIQKMLNISVLLSNFKLDHRKYLVEAIIETFPSSQCFNAIYNEITQFINDCYYKVGINPQIISYSLSVEKLMEFPKLVSALFQELREKINIILDRYKFKPKQVNLKKLPLAGIVICTSRRYISAEDCIQKPNTQNPEQILNDWFYFKILPLVM